MKTARGLMNDINQASVPLVPSGPGMKMKFLIFNLNSILYVIFCAFSSGIHMDATACTGIWLFARSRVPFIS